MLRDQVAYRLRDGIPENTYASRILLHAFSRYQKMLRAYIMLELCEY